METFEGSGGHYRLVFRPKQRHAIRRMETRWSSPCRPPPPCPKQRHAIRRMETREASYSSHIALTSETASRHQAYGNQPQPPHRGQMYLSETASRHQAYGNSISSTRALTQTVRNSVTPSGVWKNRATWSCGLRLSGLGKESWPTR